MLSSTLTLNGQDGTDFVFNEVSPDKGIGRQWILSNTDLSNPFYVGIRHQSSGKGPSVVDRHLLYSAWTQQGSDGKPYTLGCNITFIVPRNPIVTIPKFRDAPAVLLSLIAGGAFSATTGFSSVTDLNNILVGGS